jgi:ribosomal protein S18 acetylase RimI-like enzyme
MRVREARLEDAEAINQAVKKSWIDTYQGIQDQEEIEEIKERDEILPLEDLKKAIESEEVVLLVAEKEEIIGELIMKRSGDEKHIDYSNEVFLKSLYIVPEEQRNGAGRKLVEKSLEKIGGKKVRARVLKENNQAQKFYREIGFQKVSETEIGGEEKDIFTEKHEAVVMEKN